MEEKRIKAQFSVTSISDDVPQLILNEDALAIKNESNVDITIRLVVLIILKFYLLIEYTIHL